MLAILGLILATTLDSQLDAMMDSLGKAAVSIHANDRLNSYTFASRLHYLRNRIDAAEQTSLSAMQSDLAEQAQIELTLDRRLLDNTKADITKTTGALEFLIPTRGEFDTAGVYVPKSPGRDGKYSLVVLLHGSGETDADVISRQVFRDLAEKHHAILLAPWANGDDAWGPQSEAELLYVMDGIEQRMPIDERRVYMAGISMGGAGAFRIAAHNGERFAAMISIIGSLAASDVRSVEMAFASKPVYLVMGARDPIMGPAANPSTIRALASTCVPFSSYTGSGGHDLYENLPQVRQALDDMFAGTIRGVSNECSGSPD